VGQLNMKNKSVLIIASGGREHAVGWRLAQSPQVEKIYFAPGNPGTALIGENTNIPATDFKALISFAKKNDIDLTVAAPDDILAAGVVNEFQKAGLKIFGPTKEAAFIESSKAFAKELMKEENIPTARYETFTNAKKAKHYVQDMGAPIVIKASGLALGKGVVVAQTIEEAIAAIDNAMVSKAFGTAGDEIVIEEFLTGKEVSIHAFSDGEHVALFPTSRDHKPIFEANLGPNTGGMGTVGPLPEITEKQLEEIKEKIVLPAIRGLKKRKRKFVGCLYPGLMMTKDGPKVIEFNARFGDPEMETYMRLLDSDLYEILNACVDGTLDQVKIKWSQKSACCIILASAGYPASSHKGDVIKGLDKVTKDVVVFHLGTKAIDEEAVTNGGRVLGITATGKNLDEALKLAYKQIGPKGIHFEGMQYRKDIGKI
jgi:phosphoribosylamine--glycine ligase